MVIKKLNIKNFKSFGNNEQVIELNEDGSLVLLSGKNGSGKCVHPNTKIEIDSRIILKRYITILDLYKFQKEGRINLSKDNIYVNTKEGFKKIKAVDITKPNSNYLTLETKDFTIKCDKEHLLWDNKWTKANEFNIGDTILTQKGQQKILSIDESEDMIDLYDIQVDGEEYYADGFVSHNSSIIDSFDYVFYNKVGGRKNKKTKLSSLPNRINSNLENTVEFTSDNGTDVKIVRGYKPAKLELWEDGVKNERAGNSKIEHLIENHVGIDYETFKSFISMSINDFKNFLSLSPDEKKLLLDKLFNLEVINDLNKILNKLISENKKDLEVIDKEIEVITENIENINSNIEKVKQNKKDDYTKRIADLKKEIIKGKEPLGEIKEKIETIRSKKKEIEESIEAEKTTLIETKSNIKRVDEQLKLFENDKCPTCQGNLDSDFHKGLKESFIERKQKLEEVIDSVTKKGTDLASRKKKLDALLEKGVTKQNDITSDLRIMKKDYDLLLEKNNEDKDTDLDEFVQTVTNLKEKLKVSDDKKSDLADKSVYHKYLKHVFSDNGVKKTIINNIVSPINHFIHENIQQLNLPFEVTLDDKFNAQITSFGEEIDPDTLSTGENKLLSVCVLISYISLIRTKRQINVIFLDEVFSSIDVERINDVIKLLRHLADQSNINIFLIHHAVLDSNSFDKIIRVHKDIFTELEEIDIDENVI